MTISRDEATWAYRLLLGREPESEAAVAIAMTAEHRRALVAAMLASPEFARTTGSPAGAMPVIGRFLDVERIEVEVEGTPDEIDAMLQRIAVEWRRFGETTPHWSVLTDGAYRPESIAANLDRFYASGFLDLAHLLGPLSRAGLDVARIGRVMDFGCGVGRLSLALATRAEAVVGVDISPPHLALAQARAEESGVTNVSFQAIGRVEDLDRFAQPGAGPGFDLIASLIVLQHNPPPVMAAILARLLAALNPGGVAVIQIPTLLAGYRFSIAHYLATPQHPMEMNALPQDAIYRIADAAGCRPIEVREDNRIGDLPGISQLFAFQRR